MTIPLYITRVLEPNHSESPKISYYVITPDYNHYEQMIWYFNFGFVHCFCVFEIVTKIFVLKLQRCLDILRRHLIQALWPIKKDKCAHHPPLDDLGHFHHISSWPHSNFLEHYLSWSYWSSYLALHSLPWVDSTFLIKEYKLYHL